MGDPFKDLQDSIVRNGTLSMLEFEPAVMEQAKRNVGDLDLSAVSEEYNRLMWEKYRPRSFWSRIIGR